MKEQTQFNWCSFCAISTDKCLHQPLFRTRFLHKLHSSNSQGQYLMHGVIWKFHLYVHLNFMDLLFLPSCLPTPAFEIMVCLFTVGTLLITFTQVFVCRSVDFVLACYKRISFFKAWTIFAKRPKYEDGVCWVNFIPWTSLIHRWAKLLELRFLSLLNSSLELRD